MFSSLLPKGRVLALKGFEQGGQALELLGLVLADCPALVEGVLLGGLVVLLVAG
jgi:hypothetical protein